MAKKRIPRVKMKRKTKEMMRKEGQVRRARSLLRKKVHLSQEE